MNLSHVLEHVADDLVHVEAAIIQNIQTDIPLLTNVAEYILRSGGKRLRPALVLLSAKMFGYTGENTIRAAQVVEYLHTATLLHDDVVDHADMRRSQQAARNIWGNEASVVVGDYLFSMVFHMLTQLRNLEVLDVMAQTTKLMAKGELLQLARAYDSVDEQEYLDIIFNKTACLFASAVKMGASLGGASAEDKQRLYDYGMSIGIAFQIVDDALDYMKGRARTGKSIGIDLQERKVTLPLIHLLKHAPVEEQQRVRAILKESEITQDHVHEVIALMEHHGSIPYSLQVAEKYVDEAKSALAPLPSSQIKTLLTEVAEFIVFRDF